MLTLPFLWLPYFLTKVASAEGSPRLKDAPLAAQGEQVRFLPRGTNRRSWVSPTGLTRGSAEGKGILQRGEHPEVGKSAGVTAKEPRC